MSLRSRWATCRCGHPVAWHRHHRPGRDCSRCGCARPRRGGRPARRDVAATIAAVYGGRPVDVDWHELIRKGGDVVITFLHYTINGTDDRVEHVQNVTREHLDLGVLSLYQKNGEMAPEEHLGSWPLANIRSWQRKDPRAAR